MTRSNPSLKDYPAAYVAEVAKIQRAIRQWLKDHPDKRPQAQWHYPDRVWVAATINDAQDIRFLSLNEDARQMVRDCCDESHTTMMLRAALDSIAEEDDAKPILPAG